MPFLTKMSPSYRSTGWGSSAHRRSQAVASCTSLTCSPSGERVGHRQVGPVTSIDHAVWFHRRAALDEDWVLMDLLPESTGGGRGTYTGRIFSRDGTLVAGIAQESLFRSGTRRRPVAE